MCVFVLERAREKKKRERATEREKDGCVGAGIGLDCAEKNTNDG